MNLFKKEEIIKKAHFIKSGNIKLGNMWTWSTLYGNDTFKVDEVECKGTCGKHCKGCKKFCYVRKSYRYPSVIKCHIVNTIAMRFYTSALFEKLDKMITKARKKPNVIRINQSGEIENKAQFKGWCLLAEKHQEQTFYIYTKNYSVVTSALLNGDVPENLIINISVWHKQGIKEYLKVCHLPNVKAFVYMDGFKYEKYGLNIQTTCKAYEGGKLNHDITCEKCQKCFRIADTLKVIGCDDHS